ncbi:MAG: thioredoxin domain-containing protein [Homoserinimonas sp.]
MTKDGASTRPPQGAESRAGQRAVARQKARELRIEQRKKDVWHRRLLRGGIILAALLVVAIVALTIWTQIPTARTGPVNMQSDGVKIGEAFAAETTPGLQPDQEPVPSEVTPGSDVIDIRVYLDYQCPGCRVFEETNHDQLSSWLESGAATVEFHPIALFDRHSLGTKFSTRAANAAACVANYSPDAFFDFNSLMFANQPEVGTEGLTDEQILVLVKRADVISAGLIERCTEDQDFKAWVNAATARAVGGPIPNSTVERVASTPTIIVNGAEYEGALDDPEAFATFVSTSAGNAFTQKSTMEQTQTAEPEPAE